MLIRMLVQLSGNEYSLVPGDERDFPQAEALRLIAADYAAPVGDPYLEFAVEQPVVETRPSFDNQRKRRRPKKAF